MANPTTFTVSSAGITLANQPVTLVFINPGPTRSLEIRRVWVNQSANATSAQQRVELVTQVTAFPTLVAATPAKHQVGGPVSVIIAGTAGAAGTSGINASAEGAGTKTSILSDAFNVLNGWLWVPTRDEEIVVHASEASGFGLYLPVAAATLTNWAFGVTFKEL